jgi:hypothetical protein
MMPLNLERHSVARDPFTKSGIVIPTLIIGFSGSSLCNVRDVRSVRVQCKPVRSHIQKVANPLGTPKPTQTSILPVSFVAASLASGGEIRPVTDWEGRNAPTDEEIDQARELWDRKVHNSGPLEYRHTLYPQRMIGHVRHPFTKGGKPSPPRRGIGIHTAHIFLGNDPLMVEGCNLLRTRGYPEGAVMLVEDEQVCWLAPPRVHEAIAQ